MSCLFLNIAVLLISRKGKDEFQRLPVPKHCASGCTLLYFNIVLFSYLMILCEKYWTVFPFDDLPTQNYIFAK